MHTEVGKDRNVNVEMAHGLLNTSTLFYSLPGFFLSTTFKCDCSYAIFHILFSIMFWASSCISARGLFNKYQKHPANTEFLVFYSKGIFSQFLLQKCQKHPCSCSSQTPQELSGILFPSPLHPAHSTVLFHLKTASETIVSIASAPPNSFGLPKRLSYGHLSGESDQKDLTTDWPGSWTRMHRGSSPPPLSLGVWDPLAFPLPQAAPRA